MILIAYHLSWLPPMRIIAAPRTRSWMDDTDKHFANRCLPLLIANQAGWFILNNHTIRVTWDGGAGLDALSIECHPGEKPSCVSHFGHGILTWTLPFLFRTGPGINLQVRGPANMPKDGVAALEGIVETDSSMATFTMNWKVTRPNAPVIFEEGEPICMVVPQRRGDLEAVHPVMHILGADTQTYEEYREWSESRRRFLEDIVIEGSAAQERGWQKDYFKTAEQTKLKLREFEG